MSDWLISIEGTETGARVAIVLALLAAFLHALFGALQKGQQFDPWQSRAAIDSSYGLLAAPVALFVVPWPEPHMWPIFAGAVVIHVLYKFAQAATYQMGAFTVVYPVVRGTGPFFAVIGAYLIFGETFTAAQWAGLAILMAGIYGLGLYNWRHIEDTSRLGAALAMAALTGAFVALYTTYDAYGIRATADPFTFIAWFFFLDGILMPIFVLARRGTGWVRADPAAVLRLGITGALVAFASFGSIMLATRIGQVGQAAVLRETSTVFAALIGWLVLGERTGPRRIALMALIATGAVIVQATG